MKQFRLITQPEITRLISSRGKKKKEYWNEWMTAFNFTNWRRKNLQVDFSISLITNHWLMLFRGNECICDRFAKFFFFFCRNFAIPQRCTDNFSSGGTWLPSHAETVHADSASTSFHKRNTLLFSLNSGTKKKKKLRQKSYKENLLLD